jgi:transposase
VPPRKKNDPKLESLKKFGTLNPRTERVSDTLFKSQEFFDPRDLIQVKYEMLRRVKEDGWSITQAAAAYGFSRASYYESQTEFEHAGLVGFMPEKRGPREAHKLSGPVVKFIEETKQKDRSIHTVDLIKVIKERFGIDVHRRSIERALTRAKKNCRSRRSYLWTAID